MTVHHTKLTNLLLQLHSRTNETKEIFDQALVELEQQKAENDKQLRQLKEERHKWNEEKAIVERLIASASPIVNLNVGGEKMSTTRATLTCVEGSLLAMMFSGRWDGKLMRDSSGCIFLDYDPTMFKYLLNQLRVWTDPSIKRIFRLPVGSERAFLDLLHVLQFDERLIDHQVTTTDIDTCSSAHSEEAEEIERFLIGNDPYVRLTNGNRTCENLNGSWHCVFGTLNYSTGIHQLRLRLEKGTTDVLMGVCSRLRPPTGPFYYNKLSTCGWFTHRHVITNGQGSSIGWPQVNENDTLQITINCNEKLLTIVNERNRAKNTIDVNVYQAPHPWCLLLVFRPVGSRVSLI